MLFRDVYGQEAVKQTLIRAVDENRVPHAILLSGSQGTGKLPLAIAFAQYICCENRHDGDSCGTCPSCLKFNKLIHPDLHFVFPITRSSDSVLCDNFLPQWRSNILEDPYFNLDQWMSKIDSDNKQGLIYANESDSIAHKLNQKTYEAEYKTMIIWMPERFHEVCSNKILKILEEPPAKTLFILVSEDSERLLTTIVSRTQRIFVPPLDEPTLASALASRYDLNETECKEISHIANGSFIMAKEIVQTSDESKEYFELFVQVMRDSYSRNAKGMKTWTDDMARLGRKRQISFLQYAQRMIRENFILNLKNSSLNYMTNFENDFSVRFSPFVNEKNIWSLLSELESAERHIEQNAQAKLVFFDLALKLIMLLKR
ncbi:MAG TPA: DNA polymerase III subunit [Paludibacteraceae bacterium]|nr:DNA polymerase III subunit [Paludibacteraceae bacterium]HQF50514.1 DNA polymerase III subunit [Paludibacteraceae bacterium]